MLWAIMLMAFFPSAETQAHPCDVDPPTMIQIRSEAPHKVQFCAKASDNIEAVVAFVDGQTFDRMAVTALGPASLSGLILYESPTFIQISPGQHTLELATYNRDAAGVLQLGAKTPPLSFYR